jgi:aminopeptidase-like protein
MSDTIDVYYQIMLALEMNHKYRNLMPWGEPQLGKRGLTPNVGVNRSELDQLSIEISSAIRWLLSYSDGNNDVLTIAKRSGIDVRVLDSAAQDCLKAGLLCREPS